MGPPAAKMGDRIIAFDAHFVLYPPSPVPVLVPGLPFNGILNGGLSSNVMIQGQPAATLNSTATNLPPHIPPGGIFVNPPTNQGRIITGSTTVFINSKPAARSGDTALTCNDPIPMPVGKVVAISTVFIGG
jgi:uncharacterized Zn-binding protein involved in type VI secretion